MSKNSGKGRSKGAIRKRTGPGRIVEDYRQKRREEYERKAGHVGGKLIRPINVTAGFVGLADQPLEMLKLG